ncbi:tetratricopeptide repeat protein [Frondihabitans cladoniiphilus]|uniref:Tetratricopeptide repeat protein n=1 Tax=Frondihabitans cladoniiphilus TaxID=715785 RepID=A0ABP8VMC0_9MICO
MSNVPPLPAGLRGAVDLSSLVSRGAAPAGAGHASAGAPPAGGPAGPSAVPGGVVDVPSLVLDATDATFTAVLDLSSSVPVIVDLATDRSEQSRLLSPLLEKLVLGLAGRLILVRVDVDTNPQLVQAFQAQSIPTVAAVIGGRPVSLFTGALPEAQLQDVLDQVLELAAQNGVTGTAAAPEGVAGDAPGEPEPAPLPPHHQAAYDAIESGDYEKAKDEYRTAIAQDPHDQLAVAGLAQVSLLARLQGGTLADIRSAGAAAPDDLEAQLAVADLDVSGGHVVDAFDRVLTLFPKLDQAGKDAARTRLLEYFEIVGVDAPEVTAARRRLTMLLY